MSNKIKTMGMKKYLGISKIEEISNWLPTATPDLTMKACKGSIDKTNCSMKWTMMDRISNPSSTNTSKNNEQKNDRYQPGKNKNIQNLFRFLV